MLFHISCSYGIQTVELVVKSADAAEPFCYKWVHKTILKHSPGAVSSSLGDTKYSRKWGGWRKLAVSRSELVISVWIDVHHTRYIQVWIRVDLGVKFATVRMQLKPLEVNKAPSRWRSLQLRNRADVMLHPLAKCAILIYTQIELRQVFGSKQGHDWLQVGFKLDVLVVLGF